jgi:hypothetical protein
VLSPSKMDHAATPRGDSPAPRSRAGRRPTAAGPGRPSRHRAPAHPCSARRRPARTRTGRLAPPPPAEELVMGTRPDVGAVGVPPKQVGTATLGSPLSLVRLIAAYRRTPLGLRSRLGMAEFSPPGKCFVSAARRRRCLPDPSALATPWHLRARGAYPARDRQTCCPGRCPRGASRRKTAADWPPSGELRGRAEWCASRG